MRELQSNSGMFLWTGVYIISCFVTVGLECLVSALSLIGVIDLCPEILQFLLGCLKPLPSLFQRTTASLPFRSIKL